MANLKTAARLYRGSTAISRIYRGSTLMWQAGGFTPGDTTPPPVPTALAATPSTGQVALTWSGGAVPADFKQYLVRRSTTSAVTTGSPLVGTVGGAAFTDTGVTPGTTYWYAVAAEDVNGNVSALSAAVSAAVPSGTVPNPVGSATYLLAGALTNGGFTAAGTVTGVPAGASVRLAVSTSADMSSPVYSSAVTPDGAGYVKASIAGLAAGTTYWYCLELGGGLYKARTNKLRTAPAVGASASFAFAFASCDNGLGQSQAYDRIRAQAPLFFLSQGDFFYLDNTAASESGYHGRWNTMLGASRSGPMFREVPFVYTWSDHDFGPNNSYGTGGAGATVRPYAQSSYRKRMPHYTLPSGSGGIYQTFVVGRVRFIVTDNRSYKSAQAAVDNTSKTVLGTEQKAWFKSVITAATEKLILWVSDQPWSNYSAADDEWPSYNTERQELASFITASGKNVELLCGDMHALGYDAGSNSLGIPVMHAAPIHQGASKKVNTLSPFPPYPASGTVEQYALVSIADSGGPTITRTYTAYNNAGGVQFTNSKTY